MDVGIDGIQRALLQQLQIGALGIEAGDDGLGLDLLAVRQRHAHGLAVADQDLLDLGRGADLHAGLGGRRGDGLADAAHAAAREAPGADLPVHLAHVVMQQDIGRAGGIGPQRRADDGGGGGEALPARILEILVEEVADGHGPEADDLVHLLLAHAGELGGDLEEAVEIAAPAPGIDPVLGEGVEPGRVGRRHHQQRLDEAALAADLGRVMVIGLGVFDRMPAQRFPRPVMIAIGDDAFAVRIGLAVDLIGDDLQPVARQIEEAEDLGPQQAADIGAGGIGEAGIDLVRHRRPAGLAVALEHQDLQLVAALLLAAHGEIGRRRQPVMPAAHDDDVIGLAHASRLRPK